MDRRQVDHVEAHGGDARELFRRSSEGAVDRLSGGVAAAGRTWEELVPRAVECAVPLDQHGVLRAAGNQVAQGRRTQDLGDFLGECRSHPRRQLFVAAQRRRDRAQAFELLLRDGLRRAVEQPGTKLQVVFQIGGALPDGQLRLDRRAPGGDGVTPALDAVGPCARSVRGERGVEHVGLVVRRHADTGRSRRAGAFHDQRGGDGFVAFSPHHGAYRENLADHGLGGPTACDGRGSVIDSDAAGHGDQPTGTPWYRPDQRVFRSGFGPWSRYV